MTVFNICKLSTQKEGLLHPILYQNLFNNSFEQIKPTDYYVHSLIFQYRHTHVETIICGGADVGWLTEFYGTRAKELVKKCQTQGKKKEINSKELSE